EYEGSMEIHVNMPSEEIQAGTLRDTPGAATIPKIQVSEAAISVKKDADVKIDIKQLNFFYGTKQALLDVSLPIREHQITGLIGPSGCGKTTFLRTLNRMNDLITGTRTEGEAMMDDVNIYDPWADVVSLRPRVGR